MKKVLKGKVVKVWISAGAYLKARQKPYGSYRLCSTRVYVRSAFLIFRYSLVTP